MNPTTKLEKARIRIGELARQIGCSEGDCDTGATACFRIKQGLHDKLILEGWMEEEVARLVLEDLGHRW